MTHNERIEKINELKRRNVKSHEFVARMNYIQSHDFIVKTSRNTDKYSVMIISRNEKQ